MFNFQLSRSHEEDDGDRHVPRTANEQVNRSPRVVGEWHKYRDRSEWNARRKVFWDYNLSSVIIIVLFFSSQSCGYVTGICFFFSFWAVKLVGERVPFLGTPDNNANRF